MYTVYFALFAVFAQVVTVAVIHRRKLRTVVLVAALGAATLASLVPWVIAARAQLSHSAGAFWVPRLSITSAFGGLEQFFTGPPLNTWVTGFGALRALELAGDAAGCLVLVALFAYRRRLSVAGAEAARFLALAVAIGVGVMLLASFYHPLEDGKYLSSAWAPLYPLLGAGLAVLPWRRVAFGAAALTTAVAAATVLAITNPETPLALDAIARTSTAGRIVTAYPSEYLLVLYYADRDVAARARSLASSVPWFWGTAVYPAERRAAHRSAVAGRRRRLRGTCTSPAIRCLRIGLHTRSPAPAAGPECVSRCSALRGPALRTGDRRVGQGGRR